MTPSVIPTEHVAVIQHLETFAVGGLIGLACIVGILYWLYRRYRVRRAKPKKEDPKP